jgi:hypothetical protein
MTVIQTLTSLKLKLKARLCQTSESTSTNCHRSEPSDIPSTEPPFRNVVPSGQPGFSQQMGTHIPAQSGPAVGT